MVRGNEHPGLRKSRKPKGWTKHPREHAMAAHGISSRAGGISPVRDGGHVWGFEVGEDGKISVSLGNLSDAGWFWTGNEEDFVGFIARLYTNEDAWRQWNEFLDENNLSFEDMKPYLLAAVEDETSFYVLSGDNARWHFGEDRELYPEEIFEMLYGRELWETFDTEQQERIENEFWGEYSGIGFDSFYAENKEEFDVGLKSEVESADSWESLIDSFRTIKNTMGEDYWLAQDRVGEETLEKAYESLEKTLKEEIEARDPRLYPKIVEGQTKLDASGKRRKLTVPEKHQLVIAKKTLKMPDAIADVMGGPSKAEAKKIIKRLEG